MIEIKHNWTFSEMGKDQWMEAAVPGCVHTDLIRNGIIEDPFFRLNEHDVQWIDKKDWVYKTLVDVPASLMDKQQIVLLLPGARYPCRCKPERAGDPEGRQHVQGVGGGCEGHYPGRLQRIEDPFSLTHQHRHRKI